MSGRRTAHRRLAAAVVLSVLAVTAPMLGAPIPLPPAAAATLPATPASNEINGLIWRDGNADGVNDPSETGFGGVTVQLLDSGGTVVRTVTTNPSGIYSFTGLTGGPFTVRIPAAPTYFQVVGGGPNQQFSTGNAPTVGVSAPTGLGTSVNGALRPTWVVQLGTWGGGPLSGTAPFGTDPTSACPASYAPGDDCSNSDDVVRSQDVTSFLWAVSASNQVASLSTPLSNVTLVQRVVPAAGASISAGALPSVCVTNAGNPVSAVTNNPDGSVTLVCNLGTWSTSGTAKLLQWDLRVNPSPNGSTFTSTAYATSTQVPVTTPATNPVTVPNAVPSAVVTDPFVVSSGFKYDINKTAVSNSVGYATINGETLRGRTILFQFGISSPNKGNEPISMPLSFTDDIFIASGGSTLTPNPGGDLEHYITSCTPNSYSSAAVPFGTPNTSGTGVSGSGTCSYSRAAGTSSPYTITVSGMTATGPFPTKYANGSGDLTNGPYFVAAFQYQVFVPDRAMDTLDGVAGNNTGSGTLWNRIAGFDPVSTTGQSNYGSGSEPGYCDPTVDPYATNPMTSGCAPMPNNTASNNVVSAPLNIAAPWFNSPGSSKYYLNINPTMMTWNSGNTAAGSLPGMINYQDGQGLREPGQPILSSQNLSYGGEIGFRDPVSCDIFDNSTQTLTAATDFYPDAPAGTYAWFNPVGSTVGYPGSVASFWTFEYGHYDLSAVDPLYNSAYTATTGVVNSSAHPGVDTYNTTDGRYWGKWTAQAATSNGCRTSAPVGGWFTDPNLVPGGINEVNAVRMRAVDPSVVDGFTQATSSVNRNWRMLLRARETFYGGPHAGQTIPTGTVLANYVNQWGTNATSGVVAGLSTNNYVPAPETTHSTGDRATLVRGSLNIKKNTITVGGVGSGAAAVDSTGSAPAGDTIVWQIQPSGSSQSSGSVAQAVKVVDVLPVNATYDPSCTGSITGGTPAAQVEPNTPAAGQTRLTWDLGDLPYNTPWPTLRICTTTDPTAPSGTALVNTATVSSPSALSARDPHTVNLTQSAQVAMSKQVDNSLDLLNDTQVYTLRARNFSQLVNVQAMRFIEVFPYNGDTSNTAGVSRVPGSSYSGSLTLSSVPTTSFSNDPAKPAVAGTFTYTADAPATVNQDYNLNTSTWCSYNGTTFTLVSGTGACPTSLAEVTAFMFVATPDLAAISVSGGTRSVMDVRFTLQASGNKPNDWYADRFTGFTPTIRNGTGATAPYQMLQSNRVEVGTYAFYVGDLVFIDVNGDGKYSAGDALAPDGTTVELWNAGPDGLRGTPDDSQISFQTTVGGKYLFKDLVAGQVYVRIPASEFAAGGHLVGWSTVPAVGAEDENDKTSQDGSFAPDGSVWSTVHTLSYTVTAGFPTGQEPTGDNTNGLVMPARALDNYTNLTIDLGFTGTGSIGDTVWFDANADGVQDASESGIAGATVTVVWLGADGIPSADDITYTATTDADGKYSVANLPSGKYTVTASGVNATPTFDADGTATPHTASVTLAAGESRTDVDFGYGATLTLGDLVFQDVDRNGIYNPPMDVVVPDGTVVVLHRADGSVVASTTTTNGLYSFSGLLPGDYYVEIPSSQFAASGPLHEWTPTTAVSDPNTDVNNDSNALAGPGNSVVTNVITLNATFNPATRTATGSEPGGQGLTNATLDLGLIKPVHPAITVVKKVQGQEANAAPFPFVATTSPVTWTYDVSNTGDVALMSVTLTDDKLGNLNGAYVSGDTNSNGVLEQGETWRYSVDGTAGQGQQTNIGTVTGTPTLTGTTALPGTSRVSGNDPATYFGVVVAAEIKKFTNTVDANAAPGPLVKPGSTVTWTYVVKNTGNYRQSQAVTDDKLPASAIDCGQGSGNVVTLDPGQSATCTATGVAQVGQYENTGTVLAAGPQTTNPDGTPGTAPTSTGTDLSHYFGAHPKISIVKKINGVDADTAPGIAVASPGTMVFEFIVTNTGNVRLDPVVVTDSDLAPQDIVCPATLLDPGQSMTCKASLAAPAAGVVHANTATATGTPPVMADATVLPDVTAMNDAHAYGDPKPDITVTKFINELDANTAPGPQVVTGDTVNVTFLVTNSGNTRLNPVTVTDDQIPASAITCEKTALDPGQSMVCRATFVAPAPLIQHTNIGTATGVSVFADNTPMVHPVTGLPVPGVSDTDGANAAAVQPGVYVVKKINGQDANMAPGTLVIPGSTMQVTFYVANIGSTPLDPVVVTDDVIPAADIRCPATKLDVGESMTCTAVYTAPSADGQHTNTATSTATGIVNGLPLATPITDTNPANAAGANPKISIVKSINGNDANTIGTGASVTPGDVMTVTFVVTNDGNTNLVDVKLGDSVIPSGAIACPNSVLAPGASMTCTATWLAPNIGGAHQNTATVKARPTQVDGSPIVDPATGDEIPAPTDDDIAWAYSPAHPAMTIVKTINEQDANTAPGVSVAKDSTMLVEFLVTNTGDVRLAPLTVTDTVANVACPESGLNPGQFMTCTAWIPAPALGQAHSNTGTATGTPVQADGTPAYGENGQVLRSLVVNDPAHAYVPSHPGITVVKSINGDDANTAPGVSVSAGSTMDVSFLVTNTGDVKLASVTVTDDTLTAISCPATELDAGASMTCTGTLAAPVAGGTHVNTATVTGAPVLADGTPALGVDGQVATAPKATDVAHAYTPAHPGITVVKSINGDDANTTPGVSVSAGSTMDVSFLVTNTGDVKLASVTVADSVLAAGDISCPEVTLEPGAEMTCTAQLPGLGAGQTHHCLLYTSPSPRD